ncbi:cupin domain-containing protein [Demequina sp.]|uniref:cupin domain-containing protein n=1 Tax=Demequina sp. TaxID=2050685 RepID=UPI003A848A95
MELIGLVSIVDAQLALAHAAASGRHSVTLVGDHHRDLRQTLIAIKAGERLHDHDSPAEATLQVLRGEVTFTAGEHASAMSAGDFIVIPPVRHGLVAVTDCAVLLTVATRGG